MMQVRISYFRPQDKTRAFRFLVEAHHKLDVEPRHSLLAVVSAPSDALTVVASNVIPTQFALYPFFPVEQRVETVKLGPSWHLTGRSLFRLRRVGGWLGKVKWDVGNTEEGLNQGHLEVVSDPAR
jgi:hypothetical protein